MPDATLAHVAIRETLTGETPPVQWLIPEFLPRSTLVAFAGLPGAGKSFFCYTLSLALTTGTPFLGRTFESAKVLYFDQENSLPDSTQYLRWAWQGLDKPDIAQLEANFVLARFVLGHKDWQDTAAKYIMSVRPDLIVIDTTTPAFNIVDENDNGEATKALNNLRVLMSFLNPAPTIIVIKHAKLDSTSGRYTLRGAKAWEGGTDGVLFHMKCPGRPRSDGLTNTMIRPGKTRAFGLRDDITLRPEWLPERIGIKLGI